MTIKKTKLTKSEKRVARITKRRLSNEAGLTTVEYIIILCLIALFAFGAWRKFGSSVNEKVEGGTQTIDSLPTGEAN